MVYYSFDKKIISRDPIELKGRIRQVSYWKLIRLFLTDLLQLFNIFFVQYKLFHLDIGNEICYYATLAIFLLSGVITLIFNARIDIINVNKQARIMLYTIVVFVIMKYIYSWFAPPRIFSSGWIGYLLTELITSLFVTLQIPNFLRQNLVLICAMRCKFANNEENRARFYHEMVDAETDAGLVGLLECYLRGAPQLTLQIAAIFYRHADFAQISGLEQASIAAALGVVLPWTATSYHNSLRKQRNDYFPWTTVIVFFIWNTFLLASRVFSISVVLSFWPVYTGAAILVHWLIATLFLCHSLQPAEFYNKNKMWHFMFCSVFGMAYVFNIINMTKEKKCWQYLCFYAVAFMENTVCLILWCTNEHFMTVMYRISFVIMTEVLFISGIVIMVVYYTKLHPRNRKDRFCENHQFGECIPLQVIKANLGDEAVEIPVN